ncbi:hypothetical protein ACFU6O_00370 [Streptomyces albidoflavus]
MRCPRWIRPRSYSAAPLLTCRLRRKSCGALCRYGAEWTATKLRWNLTIDKQEKTALLGIASSCDGTTVTYTPAP